MRYCVQLIALLLIASWSPELRGAIIWVPEDEETIQDGIDAAEEGDTVLVEDGEYTGDGNVNLAIQTRITVMSEFGPAECIINGEQEDLVIAVSIEENAVFSGFTVTGMTDGAIQITDCDDFIIRNCLIINNSQEGGAISGAGMVINSASGLIEHCIFSENNVLSSAAAILFLFSNTTIFDCIFTGNEAGRFGGALLISQSSDCTVLNCIFSENNAGIDGGAIAITRQSSALFANCSFTDNVAVGMGGGLYKGSDSTPEIVDCIFWGNEAETGSQLYAQDNGGEIVISYCDVEGGPNEDDGWDGEELIDEDPQFVEGRDPEWGINGFFLDPDSPCIDAGSVEAREVDMDTLTTQTDLTPDEDEVDLGWHYARRSFRIIGTLFGLVTNAADDSPIENALVVTSLGQNARTNEEGEWRIEEAIAAEFNATASKQGYNDSTLVRLVLEEDEELEVNFSLLHPEFAPSDDELEAEINTDDSTHVEFSIENEGNGPLRWTAEVGLRGDADHDPWELRASIAAGIEVDNRLLKGVVFTDGLFYISGGVTDSDNLIYVFNREGEYIEEFAQPDTTLIGMRDLAWDGELIWGSGGRTVYGITTDGRVERSWDGPYTPNSAITWDTDRDMLWIGSSAMSIVGYDRDGNEIENARLSNHDMRISGLAYWAEDPDGYPLYVFYRGDDANARQEIAKIDPDRDEFLFVARLHPDEESTPEGAFITKEFDPYSIIFAEVSSSGGEGDRIDIYQLDANKDWMRVAPVESELEAGEEEDCILTLSSFDMPEGDYEGEIRFTHNAAGGQAVIPIFMDVVEGPVQAIQHINLSMGWNLISAYLQPDEGDIPTLTRELVDAGLLMLVKDHTGRFYAPALDGFSNLGDWSVARGYYVKMAGSGELSLDGMTVSSEEPIPLREGWQMVAYYPRRRIRATIAFSGIEDDLTVAKDETGRFYLPDWNFSNMGYCNRGEGYIIHVQREGELVWRMNRDDEINRAADHFSGKTPELSWFTETPSTAVNMSLLVQGGTNNGGEVGIYANDRLVGSGIIAGGRCGIAVWGDDRTTPVVDGALEGQDLKMLTWSDRTGEQPAEYVTLQGEMTFGRNDVTVVQLDSPTVPREFGIEGAYPNPFNSTVRLDYRLIESGHVNLTLYDLSGREIIRLLDGFNHSGHHAVTVDASLLSSGVYFIRLTVDNKQDIRKIVCIK